MSPQKGISEVIMYDAKKVEEKFGVRPDQIIDYKALSGDSSDNIPGVPGIGPKGATELLKEYGNLDNIYSHLEYLPAGQKKKLAEGRESAYLSQRIATIQLNAPIDFEIETYRTHRINYEKAKGYFAELEFKSLDKKLEELRELLEAPKAEQQAMF
jgi:DNA polymerase-1